MLTMEIHRSFKIPLKARRPSEDCQYTLPADSREAKEIEYAIKRQTWDTNDLDRAVSILLIKKVDNPSLEKEYREKKSQLREEGRSTKELSQQMAFCLETDDNRVKEICQIGLECSGSDHTLGDGRMGVTVWRCPDLCIRTFSWPASGSAFLLVFKIVKGRVKSVTPRVSPETPNLEPTPNHDCHISRNTVTSSVTDLTTLLRNTQYYLYEYDDEGLPSKRPRHCLPFAVVPLKRNEMTSPRSPKRPLTNWVSNDTPVSPAKELTKHTEEFKAPSFTDDDGILIWRGLVTSGIKSLGRVSLLAGHKLGVNFWKSYLDVSRKIPLRQLTRMLPGDLKSGWKWPLLYRNYTLSVCTMKQAQDEPCETFTSFTRHLLTKAKSAGVLCIDSNTTMFLIPSGKLAIHLGFCETEVPPRIFCIVCRRHASPLTLGSACGRSAFRPYSSTTVNNEAIAIEPSLLDLKTQYSSKIIVSSTEDSLRLAPKLTPLRQILKRSLSFPYSPAKVAKKGLPRIVRSASSSVGVGSKEETPMRPEILPALEVSCDGSRRKDNYVYEDSCAWDSKNQIAAESTSISLNSLADGEKFEEENSYMDSKKTAAIILEGSAKNVLTLKTSPAVSKKATLRYSESEEQSCQSLQLPEVQATCNTSPNFEANKLSSSADHPLLSPHSRQTWMKTRESLSKSLPVQVTLKESFYAQNGPLSPTAVRQDDHLSLTSTNAGNWALQSSRMTSTPFPLASSTVQASNQESSCKEHQSRLSVTDKIESETSLRSDSRAHSPVRWSCVTTTEASETSPKVRNESDRNFSVIEMTASSGPDRKHCNVAESRSELVFECPRGKMRGSGVIPLSGENVSSSCSRANHNHPQSFAGQNCIPFPFCGSEDSPLHKGETVASKKGLLVHPGMNGSCSDLSKVTADKKTFFCVDVENVLEGSSDKLELQSSLRGDGLNPTTPANVPQNHYNSELYDSLQIVDMEFSDSSTDSNNEDAWHNLKIAPDLSENVPLYPDGDLHDNLETVDMEISETSNFETLHLNNEFHSNSISGEASLTDVPCTGRGDKRETVNVEVSDLTPGQTVSSQSYSDAPLTICYDSSGNQSDDSSKTPDSIGLHERVNDVEDSREEQRLGQTMLASFPNTGLVQQFDSAFSEPSCLVASQPSTNKENTFKNIGSNAIEQTKSSSMDPLVTTAISTTRKSALSVDMDISDDSEVITVSCEKDNSGGYRLEVFCNLSRKDNSQSEHTNSNTQISAKTWEETVEETAKETAEDTVSLGVTSDHLKFTSPKRGVSYPSTGPFREHGTSMSSITDELHQVIEDSVPSASASDTQTQISFPKKQESATCGTVITSGKVSSFSLSPPKSPKVSVRKLKMLQDAFKAETDMSGFTSDSKTNPPSPAKVLKYISHKSSFHSTVKHSNQSCVETSESSYCMGVQNSAGSSTPAISSTALEKDVIPKQTAACTGGVIEMSLIEDWGFHSSKSDCSEGQLKVNGRCQPQTGEGDDLDKLVAEKAVEASTAWPVIEDNDFPEPETVVCSPMALSETFNFGFRGESDSGYHSNGDSKATVVEEETSLVKQRFRGDVQELMRSSDVKPATMLSPSGILVSKPIPAKEYSEDATAINERDNKESPAIVTQLASDMDSAPVVSCAVVVPKACSTTECSETDGFKKEWSITEISRGDSLVSDDDVSVAGFSRERTQKYSGTSKSVNTDRVLKIPVVRSGMVVELSEKIEKYDKLRSSEEKQDTLAILLETSVAPYLPVSDTHSSKAEKLCIETVPLSRSTTRFDNLSFSADGNTIEAKVSSTVAHKNEGCPKHVARESVSSFPGQANEGSLFDGKKDRDSSWELLEEEHATNVAGKAEHKNCSVKAPVEEEKSNVEGRATATEIKSAIVDCSVPGKEVTESGHSTENTEPVMPAVVQDNGKVAYQEFPNVTISCQCKIPTLTAAKERESHLESRAGKRSLDHVSGDRTMQTTRRIEEYTDCSRTESRSVSTKAESTAGMRKVTSNRSSEVSSESFSTIQQNAKPGDGIVEPVLKWDIRCKTEHLSSKTAIGSGKAAKDRKPSDQASKSEKTQTHDEVNSESSSRRDRSRANSLHRGFAAAEGRILDEKREGNIKSRKSAEIKTGTTSQRGQSSIDSEGSSIGDARNSNGYAYSSKRDPPHSSTGTLHAYKEVRSRQEKGTTDDFSAPYRDTRSGTESSKDTNRLQRDNMVQYTKFPWEPGQWGVHNLERGRKRQKMTPPPPLISLGRGLKHGPHQRWGGGEAEASNGDNQLYPPCFPQPESLFPRGDCITEQQCPRTIIKHRSYPCWVSPQPSLLPVTNKGRAMLHHLIPDYPRWHPEGAFSSRDPRRGQNQFEQVYPGSLVHERPICVPSPCRGQPVLAPPPPLIPGLWALPGIPYHQTYPMYRPK